MVNGYEYPTLDVTCLEPGYFQPDISGDAGNTYPPDFLDLMPGFVVPTVNVNNNGLKGPRGDWTTPQAYSWHSSDLLTTNPEIDGKAGRSEGVAFAFGGVESSTVENFEMLGNQAVFQTPDVMNWGDVGYANTSGILAASVASQTFNQVPFETWSASVIAGI